MGKGTAMHCFSAVLNGGWAVALEASNCHRPFRLSHESSLRACRMYQHLLGLCCRVWLVLVPFSVPMQASEPLRKTHVTLIVDSRLGCELLRRQEVRLRVLHMCM